MKKTQKVLSLFVCVAMLVSLLPITSVWAQVKIKGDVITSINFENAASLDSLADSVKYVAYGGGKNAYTQGAWSNALNPLSASNTDFEFASDGDNKYLQTTSQNGAGDALIPVFTETTPENPATDVFAVEYDLKLNYSENGGVIFDVYSDSLKPTSYFKIGVTDENSGYVELRYGEKNESGNIALYEQEEKIAIPLGEFVNFRIEFKSDKWLSGANKTNYNNYRLFINDTMVSDFKNLQVNNSGMVLTKFQAAGFRSNAAGTSYAIDNIKFYQLEELTAPSLSRINISAAGELEQYVNSASEITFSAAGNVEIADSENITWYVNDVLQGITGANFVYTPEAVVGNYEVYAKYGELSSGKITVVMNKPETLNEITITSDGNLAQKGELSQVNFTAAGNIEIPTPENITWYVNGVLQNSTGKNFAYTPTSGGSFCVKAIYDGIESNFITIDVIHYADPTEQTQTETTVLFSATNGTPGVSGGDPNRFNKASSGAHSTITVDENKLICLKSGLLDKAYIRPVKSAMLSAKFCLFAPAEGENNPNGYMAFGHSASASDKYLTYTYNAETNEFEISVKGTKIASIAAGEWFDINVYLYASSNDNLQAAWENARALITISGNLKDADGNSKKSISTVFDRSFSLTADSASADIVLRISATSGTMYIDDYIITYPGTLTAQVSTETYGDNYGMVLDGKLYIKFNRNINLNTVDNNVTVKDNDGKMLHPQIITNPQTPDTIIVDFAEERLSENAKYTIEISNNFKDVTGRHLLDNKIEFETLADPSDDAFLSKLVFTEGDSIEEVPVNGFFQTIETDTEYNVQVDSDVDSVKVIAEAANSRANVTITPADGILDLSSGSGIVTVTVTSADLSKTVVHTINFTKSEHKLVESIELKPESLTVWADFKGDLTLTSSVLPETAADRSLVWSSSDENVVKVDMTGKLILVGEGSATIRATAADGSGIYGEMSVTVTPAINRAENQKLNLDSTSTPRINIEEYVSLPENVGDAQIAMWYNNATGVFTLTVDDSIVEDYQYFKEYYDKYGVKTTMFVPVKYYSRARYLGYKDHEMWAWADAQEGLTVQSHSYSHDDFNAMGTAEIAADYIKARDVLSQYITQPAEVVAYASGIVGDADISREIHIAGRGVYGHPNHGDRVDYMCTNSLSGLSIDPESRVFIGNAIKSIYTKDYYTYGTNYYGGWLSTHYHGISNGGASANEILAKDKYGEDATPEQLASEEFYGRDSLDYAIRKFIYPAMQEGKVWSATFAEAAKYGQERDTAVLTMKKSSASEYVFAITDQMDDTIFTHPLTVKIKVANNWTDVLATQNGSAVKAELKEIDGAKYVFVDAVPDKGEVVVTNTGIQEETKEATIDVSAINGTISAIVNNSEPQDWQDTKKESFAVGTKLCLTADSTPGSKFMYWINNDNSAIVSYDKTFEFTVGTSRSITAVFSGENEIFVTFRNMNGNIVKSGIYNSEFTVPDDPYVYGYKFNGWYIDAQKQNFSAGEAIGEVTANTIFKAGYIEQAYKFSVEYNGESKEYSYNEKATFTAEPEKDGKVFAYWLKDGNIVSYDLTYSFYVNANLTIEAVYGENKENDILLTMATPIIVSGNKIAFFAERNIPENYTLIETGILIGKNSELTVDNALHKAIANGSQNVGQFTIRKANVNAGEVYYAVAYAICSDAEGNVFTVYSNEVSKSL